jgi:hypothetical protein
MKTNFLLMKTNYTFLKITALLIFLLSGQLSFAQTDCSPIPNWTPGTWDEPVQYNGKIYAPCYGSTSASLSDPNNRDEAGCEFNFWGFVDNCSTTLALPQNHNFDAGFESWVSGGQYATLDAESDLNNLYSSGNFDYTSCGNFSGNVIVLRGSGGSPDRILTSPSYDMTGYDSVIFDYDYFVSSMDNNNEGWNLDYSNDNGSSWVTVKTYRRNSQFDNLDCGPNDTGNKELVILDNATYSFTNQSKFRMYTERDGGGSTGAWDYLIIDNVTLTGNITSTCSATGSILMERYDGISGTSITDLTGSTNYPNNPSSTLDLTSFEIPANVADNYGARVSGYICAPETGYYTFWMASDDNGELNLSTDEDPANKTTIAYVTAWTPQNVWDDEPNQKSNPVFLIAGNSYYVEALMKEQGGGDHLSIGWAKPGETTTAPSQIIPGSVLSPVVDATCTDAVTLPWNEGFETVNNDTYTSDNSNVGNCWEYQEDNVGRLSFDQVSHTGSKAALLDTDTNSDTQNYLTKTLNLSDYTTVTDLELSFWFFDGSDENSDGDAVWIRGNNTASWIKIYDILPENFTDRQWNQITDLDIDSILASNGQVVSSTFQIRLGQYDNYFYASSGLGSDGIAFDDLQITGTTIDCSGVTNTVTNANATAGDAQATLSWLNPNATCVTIDEVMVVAKAASPVTTAPTGNGSAYTANATFGSGTTFDGGYVVYKGTEEALTITGLTNGTTYHLTTFTRENTLWSTGVTVTVTSIESPYLFFEDFEGESDEAITGTDVNGIAWSATLNGHDADYFGVDTQSSNKLFRADDFEDNKEGIKWESNVINIAGKTNLELSAYLEFDGTDDNDYLRVKVLVDGFFTTTVASFDDNVNDQDGNKSWLLVDASNNPITGNTLKIVIEFFHDSNEEYLVDNIRLTDGNYWLGNETDAITNTEKWSLKELPTPTSNVKIAAGAHLKLSNDDFIYKNFSINGALTIDKDASLTTTEDFKNSGDVNLNSDDNEFSSLLVEGTSTGSVAYNRWVNNFEAGTNGNDVIASPVFGESWANVMANNQSSIFTSGNLWAFNPYNNGYASWGDNYTSSTTTNIISGKGYRVSTPPGNSQAVKFTGEVQTGTVNVTLRRIQTRWNVVGNPYATYIDLAAFIQANTAVLDEGYVLVLGYNGVNNTDGWAYYNLATALANNVTIAPGQGFYLAAKTDNVTVTFTPSMRTVNGADDFLQDGARSAMSDMYKLRLNVNNSNKTRHAEFYFFNRDDVSNNFDLGYDALIKNDGDNFNLYSALLANSLDKLAIQTMSTDNLDTTIIIPIGVEAQSGQQLTFSIDNVEIPSETIVWLEDRENGVWTELNSTSTYVINTTEVLTGIGRFYIHFENEDTLTINEVNANEIEIKAIMGSKTIIVNGNLNTNSILELYDINGRKVLTQVLDRNTTTHHIDASFLPTAAYIVIVHNDTQKSSKQIIIN